MIEPSSVLKAPTKPRVRLNDQTPLSRQPWVHLDDPISAACRAVVQRRSSSTLEKFMGKTLRVATLKGKFLKKILSHLAKILRARGRKIQGHNRLSKNGGYKLLSQPNCWASLSKGTTKLPTPSRSSTSGSPTPLLGFIIINYILFGCMHLLLFFAEEFREFEKNSRKFFSKENH
jgi:hypothetical protein